MTRQVPNVLRIPSLSLCEISLGTAASAFFERIDSPIELRYLEQICCSKIENMTKAAENCLKSNLKMY